MKKNVQVFRTRKSTTKEKVSKHTVVGIGLYLYQTNRNIKIKMSNSLNKSCVGRQLKYLDHQEQVKQKTYSKGVQRYLEQGYSPDEICYVSFTNKAVNECVARVRKKFKEYDEDDFSIF